MLMFCIVFILLTKTTFSIKEEDYFNYDKTPGERYYAPAPVNNNQRRTSYDVPPAPRYEVTEEVIDIPDDRGTVGAVITNYTLSKPLNNASNSAADNDTKKGNKNIQNTKQENNNNAYYHSLHEAKYNEHSSKNIVQKIHKEIIPNIKEVVHDAKNSIAEIHNVVNKEFSNVIKGLKIPNIVASPELFFNKVHEKSSAASKKVHKTIFGDEFDDYDDEYF